MGIVKSGTFGVVICLTFIVCSMKAHAFEVWHTPSGKSYQVHVAIKTDGKKKGTDFYIVSYKTNRHLDDTYGLRLECYDLLTYLYYTHMKKGKTSGATIEAFKVMPKPGKNKAPSRRITRSLSEIKKIVKKHKKTDPYRLKAFQYFNQKKYKEALGYFSLIKSKVPHDYSQKANAQLFTKDREKAFKTLRDGIKRFPNNILLLNNLAMATMLNKTYYYREKFVFDPVGIKSARKTLKKALSLDKSNWLTHSNMAILERTAGNYRGAEKFYLKALKLSQNSPELYFQIGGFYHEQKKFRKAEKYYKAALKKIKQTRSPASNQRIEEINRLLKLVKSKKAPQ